MLPLAGWLFAAPLAAAHAMAIPIPARFAADRVFATPIAANGQPLRLYTDTGGGGNLLCRSAAERLGVALEPAPPDPEREGELGKNLARTHWPAFERGAGVPANADGNDELLVHDCKDFGGVSAASMGDGLLSSRWFAGRIWTWDYAAERLAIEGAGWKAPRGAHRTAIGFKAGSTSAPAFAMPRIGVRIDGRDIDLLLDTGATGYPTPAALQAQPTPVPVDGARATSFITTSTLEAWRAAHPDWLLVEDADRLGAPRLKTRAIRVPRVDVAGFAIGPVWFTERRDRNFSEMMSSMTDRPVVGALGGNALAHMRMTLNYPRAAAYFECVRDCAATPPPAP